MPFAELSSIWVMSEERIPSISFVRWSRSLKRYMHWLLAPCACQEGLAALVSALDVFSELGKVRCGERVQQGICRAEEEFRVVSVLILDYLYTANHMATSFVKV